MKLSENHNLEQILESAIVASWEDLTHNAQPGLIHIEYNFAAGGTLDGLKIWSSIARGHWLLLCEYWMFASNSHSSGVRFDNGYQSEGLAHTLEFVRQRQNAFALPPNLGRPVYSRFHGPEAESAEAAALVRAMFNRFQVSARAAGAGVNPGRPFAFFTLLPSQGPPVWSITHRWLSQSILPLSLGPPLQAVLF